MYKLSICMMVKDEEKNLRRCLNSISPLIEEGMAELIIVDTGSSDGTVDIAKEYTDKVYFHLWNNDFSSMRNISISYATGQWIFILDADERLDNLDKLKYLIQSQEIEDFNSILLKVKNLNNLKDEEHFNLIVSPRIFRNDGNFKYEGAVHNQPIFKGPNLSVDIYLTHFGYDVTDKKLMEKKFIRTSTLLKKELKKDPQNLYYKYQLGVTYDMHSDFQESLEEFRQCYKILKNKDKTTKLQYIYIYCSYIRLAVKTKKYAEIIGIAKESIKLKPDYLDLYYLLALAEANVGNDEEAFKYFSKYLEISEKYEQTDISSDMSIIMYHLDKQCKENVYYQIAQYYINKKDYCKCFEYAVLIDDKIKKSSLISKIIVNLGDIEKFKIHYEKIKEDKTLTSYFLTSIELEINKLEKDKQEEIYNKFSQMEYEYGLYCKIKTLKGDKRIAAIKEFLNIIDFNEVPLFYSQVFNEILDDSRFLLNYYKKINFYSLRSIVEYLLNKFQDSNEVFKSHLLHWNIRYNDLSGNKVYVSLANSILIKEINEKEEVNEENYTIFKKYIENGINYVSQLYKMEKSRVIYKEVSNEEDQFFILMFLVQEYIDKNDLKSVIKYFKEALIFNRKLIKYLNMYNEEVLTVFNK